MAGEGASTRLNTRADVLSTLMPLVGRVPGDDWKAAKLYAPHAARVLAELSAAGQAPTVATARLLHCCAQYASEVLLDYQHVLGYSQRLLQLFWARHGEGDHPEVA